MAAPVIREVLVSAAPDRAFDLFIDRIGAWWPLDGHAVFGDGTLAFEGPLLVERSGERDSVWAEVLELDRPDVIVLTWHPGSDGHSATAVRVTFTAHADQTLVTLVHRGWERMADPDSAAAEYGKGWPGVLSRYRELVGEVGA